jgi:pyroglutamyl-peptidase
MRATVLITGFGPFPGAPYNPTARLAEALARCRRPGLTGIVRIAHVFRTSYAAVDRELPALVARHRPNLILMFGLAQRTRYLRIETRAMNRRAALFADVDGAHPALTLRFGGPRTLMARAPHHALQAATRTGVPVRCSIDAGKYVCNFAYWRALELAVDRGSLVQFVHVPKVRTAKPRRRADRAPELTQADLFRAGEAILRALVTAARERVPDRSRLVAGCYNFDSTATRSKKDLKAVA